MLAYGFRAITNARGGVLLTNQYDTTGRLQRQTHVVFPSFPYSSGR